MTPALLAELVAMAEEDGRPMRRLLMHPDDAYQLVKSAGARVTHPTWPRAPNWHIHGVAIVADPWCPRGTVGPDPPLARPARCRIHEDCRAYPELARACWEARWRSG